MRGAVIAAVAACLAGTPALAQQVALCGPRGDMGDLLASRFGELPEAAGLVGDRIVELMIAPSGSWTILLTSADGRSCVLTGGDNWTDRPPALKRPPVASPAPTPGKGL